MERCFKCGVPANKVKLFDAISNEGLVKICEQCSKDEHIPVIKKPTTFQLKKAERKQTFYEKASRSLNKALEKEKTEQKKQDISLREIVDKNYEQKISKKASPRPEMVDNYHWIIMRARRMKKLTQAKLAKEIAESEAAIKMAEQGILPEDDYKLVNKLENYLGIKIVRPEFKKEINSSKVSGKLSFDRNKAKILTIDDLRKLKKEKKAEVETESKKGPELEENELISQEREEGDNADKGEISKEEMDEILFGK